ncbi:Type IV pilus biogenesis and competence protein PilQ precursor [Rubripirellula tenax]|uniref:Type IV pilus biogenesis and competence protein PilQ n=1 Tax=Rubripirellula tenax TaxID=2528015 RepID=A0A5C6FB31_9BACT|nr:secretin N-terminal domain-containing protein [Rubripirellula tenax]TWU58628.1 Type IV pilus biogenesis and competence protein PilQ precursor [Rubripirellula tenax]
MHLIRASLLGRVALFWIACCASINAQSPAGYTGEAATAPFVLDPQSQVVSASEIPDWLKLGTIEQVDAQVDAAEVTASATLQVADLIRVNRPAPVEGVDLSSADDLVTLIATGAELTSVLRMIADHHGLNLVVAPDIAGPVTVSIRGARLDEVLDAILGVAGFSWHRVGNLLYVTGASSAGMDPRVQGRFLQVYPLDYVAAKDIEPVATSLLSQVGNAFASEAAPADQLRTREVLVVEDTAAAHQRIAQYIAQIDVPPKQVLIEAHVLQISLTNEERHGVDLLAMARVNNSGIELQGTGFTDGSTTEPTVALRIKGNDLTGLVEMIESCTNSRTLASPKLSVINHQEAKIQIGQRLPYSVSTTTQTTTVQSVEFLEVGIVLTVRPVITDDGNVLMTVLPKVSGGKILQNGFPEEETTEVQTTIMIPDGGGVVIGGLIREENLQSQSMIPWVGKIPILGHLFRRKAEESRRNELVVALVTHVIHDCVGPRQQEIIGFEEAVPDFATRELTRIPYPSGLVQ